MTGMAKPLSEASLRKVAREELDVLEGIIDYAEQMIRAGDLAYRNLKRNAYGKALVIERENEGVATFRLGMDSLVYPKASSGYATPHSPVGRLCAVAGVGFESFSKAWGDYRVTEARQFRRHDLEELERHARNFLAVGVENANGQGKVMDLRAFLTTANPAGQQIDGKQTTVPSKKPAKSKSVEKPIAVVPPIGKELLEPAKRITNEAGLPNTSVTEVLVVTHPPEDRQPAGEPVELTPSVPAAPRLQILDDDVEEDSALAIADLDDVDDEVVGELVEQMSLDEHFFLNRTPNQDKIISREPVGPMWVEGVAGSGKTSAALGRTKMLCDFNSNEVTDRETFRSILGDDFDYWEGEFAGKFSQDGSVGFVRTAELIQYLKQTCSRLGMSGLQVLEYHELRSKLRSYRHLESSGGSGKRFKHSSDEGHSMTTTLAWLNASRLALARVIAVDLQKLLVEVPTEQLQRFTAQQRSQFAAARHALAASVDELVQELLSPSAAERALYRLAARLLERIQALAQRILGPATLSIHLGGHMAYGEGIPELAQRLAKLPVDLFQQPNQVLVLYRAGVAKGAEALPCVSSSRYQYLSTDNQPLSFNDAVQASLTGKSVRVLLPSLVSDDGYETKFMPVNELFIALGTPKSLLYLDGEVLKWLKVSTGIGSQVLPGAGEQARTSVLKIFQQLALDYLAKPLKNFAGLYAKALYEYADSFPDAAIAWQVLERLEEQRLCDSDIDLLLCLAHDLSAGVTAKLPAGLHEAAFYQSVFVDEVQDFSEQQIYLMTSQADPSYSAITVVGDRSQQLLHNEEVHIADCFPIGKRPEFVALDENLRQKGRPDLAALSTVLRQLFARGAETDAQQLDAALLHDQVGEQGAYTLRGFTRREEEFRYLCEEIAAIPENHSVAVVVPDQETARSLHALCAQKLEGSFRKMSVSEQIDLSKKYLVHFTSVLHVKGLEFDVVLLPMIDQYDLGQPVFRNRLYVGCTRARQRLLMSRLR